MKYRLPLTLGLVAASVAGAWIALRPPELPEHASAAAQAERVGSAKAAAMVPPTKLAAAAVLSIDPRANPGQRPAPTPVSLHAEFLATKQYRPLYDRLQASGEGRTREGLYVMYEMLLRCANVTDRTSRRPVQRAAEQKRDDFVAAIPENDPMRAKRIAAFDEVAANRCSGMESITIAQADLSKMLADAAAMGDPKAQAASLERELWQARRTGGRDSVTLTDAQVENLRQIVATKDPEAMIIAGRILSNPWREFSMRVGPEGQTIEQRAFNQAWQLLACDYGYPCGENNPRLLSACAFNGHCNATSLPDYLFYYGASPHDSQLLTQYRSVLRQAIETGDWSQVTVARGPRLPGPPGMMFRPGG